MRFLVVLLLISLAFAGCSDKDEEDKFETPSKDEHGRYIVELRSDRTFDPAKISVPKQAGVVFIAKLDGCDVRSDEPGGPDSSKGAGTTVNNRLIPKGDEYAWAAPNAEAEYHIACTTYEDQGMTAVLRVG